MDEILILSPYGQAYLDANPIVPWDDLRYIFGEIMYGGHITDPWDRRTCNTYLTVRLHTLKHTGWIRGDTWGHSDMLIHLS
jgi:hypothetical protein